MIYLREAKNSDLGLIMTWRNNPIVYEGFYQQNEPLKWEEHLAWWKSRNKDWREFIVVSDERNIGAVTIGQLDHWNPEIGYFIGEVSLWGQGIGKEAVKLALKWLKNNGYEYCHTTVLKDNPRSLNLLKGLGFQVLGDARKGEVWLTKNL